VIESRAEQQTHPLEPGPAPLSKVSIFQAADVRPAAATIIEGQDRNSASARASTVSSNGGVANRPAISASVTTIPYLPLGSSVPVDLIVEREEERRTAKQDDASGLTWTVRFAFDSAELGPIHAAIRLGGGGIGVKLWAERPEVAIALERDTAELRSSLQEVALDVEAIAIEPGRPPRRQGETAGPTRNIERG
jgi:hypothetical protein